MLTNDYNEFTATIAQKCFEELRSRMDLLKQSEEIEGALQDILREAGRLSSELLYNEAAQEAKEKAREPSFWVKRQNSVTFYTIFGPISVASPYLYNASKQLSKTPTRQLLGIEGKARSQQLEKALVDFGAEHSFHIAAQRFQEHYGWRMSESVLRLVTLDYGKQCSNFIEKHLKEQESEFQKSIAERPGVPEILVELDGCEIRTCKLKKKRGRGKTWVRSKEC